ncbi:MAG TPA: hypothetical protein VK929_02665 [Longimicrobiales bacterium]|nr:hypothetical protein [Longimicrobiales bacterium]
MKRTMKLVTVLAAAMAVLGPARAARAQASGGDEALVLRQENLTLAKDSARSSAAATLPGDTLRFHLDFTNTQDAEVRNVAIDNPLPGGLVFIGGSAQSDVTARIEYSVDGGVSYSPQPMVEVTDGGRTVALPADPATYTHVRWVITDGVAPGSRVTARYDVLVGARPAPPGAVRQ